MLGGRGGSGGGATGASLQLHEGGNTDKWSQV